MADWTQYQSPAAPGYSGSAYPYSRSTSNVAKPFASPKWAKGAGMNLLKNGFFSAAEDMMKSDGTYLTPKYKSDILNQGANSIKNSFHNASKDINASFAARNMDGQPAAQAQQQQNALDTSRSVNDFWANTSNELDAQADSMKKDWLNTLSNWYFTGQQLLRQDLSLNENIRKDNMSADAAKQQAQSSWLSGLFGSAGKIGSSLLSSIPAFFA